MLLIAAVVHIHNNIYRQVPTIASGCIRHNNNNVTYG